MSLERAALEELARRQLRHEAAQRKVAALKAELFAEQLAVWESESEQNAVICPRRAGKTSLWARMSIGEALLNDRVLIRIWHVSRIICKKLMWEELKYTCDRHGIKYKDHDVELTLRLENGSEIQLVGADKDKEAHKKRGFKTWLEIVLEVQNFGPMFKAVAEDIIEPSLLDMKPRGGGKFYAEGTPGIVCAGHWWDITGRDERLRGTWESVGDAEGNGTGWTCFRWQSVDNPHMPQIAQDIARIKAKRRWTDDNPTYCREYKGLWVNDYDALYYRYNERRNGYSQTDVQPWGPGWSHVLGWDLGSLDDMALVVWGFHENLPDLYEAFSWKKPGALSHEVIEQIEGLERRGFNIIAMVADTQGGGKMYVEDVQARYSHTFEPAAKSEKYQHVTLFNDDLLTAHVRLQVGSPYENEIKQLPRDPDWDKDSGKPPGEAPAFANHCCDAGLYSWRKARHYWSTPKKHDPAPGTPEAVKQMEDELVQRLIRRREADYLEQYASGREAVDPLDSLDSW